MDLDTARRSAPSGRVLRSASAWSAWLAIAFADRPARVWHSRAVWHRAAQAAHRELRGWPEEDRRTLELASLLHDVGLAIDGTDALPHGVVGAALLVDLELAELAPLVASHSAGAHEAQRCGTSVDRFGPVDADALAVLTYLDRTTSPSGTLVTIAERRRDLVERYGSGSLRVHLHDLAVPDARAGQALLAGGVRAGRHGSRRPQLELAAG